MAQGRGAVQEPLVDGQKFMSCAARIRVSQHQERRTTPLAADGLPVLRSLRAEQELRHCLLHSEMLRPCRHINCKMVRMLRSRLCDIRDSLSSTLSDRLTETDMSRVLRIEGPNGSKEESNARSTCRYPEQSDSKSRRATFHRNAHDPGP
jgi:hypothetical protein